jgi:hypothetical protein
MNEATFIDDCGRATDVPFLFPFQAEGNNSLLVSAHLMFQRMAIAMELVEHELHLEHKFHLKVGRLFKLCKQTANRIVESLHVLLMARTKLSSAELRTRVETTVPRRVAARVACLPEASKRNIRDWVILSSSEIIAHFYKHMFHLFEQHHYK